MPIASAQTLVSLAKEVARATPVTPATIWLPVRPDPKIADVIKYLDDKGQRGSMVENYNKVQGVIVNESSFAGDVFPDTFPNLMQAMLGGTDVVTGAGPYSHVMSLLNNGAANTLGNQPASYTYYDANGNNQRQVAAWQLGEVAMKFSADGLLEYTAKAWGNQSVVVANPTSAFSSAVPLPAWDITANIAGAADARIGMGELLFHRNVTPIWTGQGTQSPYRIWAGPIKITGKATFIYEPAEVELATYFLTNSQPIFTLTATQPVTAYSLLWHMQVAAFTIGRINRSKDYVEIETEFEAMPNATDASSGGVSPVKFTVSNGQSTTY
jgi:hypothetical protein